MGFPQKLIDAYKGGAIGIFIGAGISQGSGLPNWEALLMELIKIAEDNHTDAAKIEEMRVLVRDSSNYLMVAQELKDLLDDELAKHIKTRFDTKTIAPSEILFKILKLKYKFIVTTNYDTLIEKAFIENKEQPNDLTYKDASSINYNLISGEKFVLKAHGDARRAPNEIIITEKDYRRIIYQEQGYRSVLGVIFSVYHNIFFGASLKDPELKLMLGYIHDTFHEGTPDHFAFMPKSEITQTEIDRWRKDYHINVITYDSADGHKELSTIIDELGKIH